jgi:tRNA threonylcarbamoyladenosine biosynthesis protein TsaB
MIARQRKLVNPPATILSFDCSAAACSAAVWRDGENLAARFSGMTRGHAEALMPMIIDALAAAQVEFAALDAIAVTVGPGSFTGIRIGLSVARGLALAAGLPIVGLTTLATVAAAVPMADRPGASVQVLLDSKRGDLYCAAFAGGLAPIGTAMIAQPADVAALLPPGDVVLVGDGVPLARPHVPDGRGRILLWEETDPPNAAVMGALARRLVAADAGLPPQPLYMRPAQIHPGGKHTLDSSGGG